MFLVIWRTFKESLINFWRNGWLTVAAVSVLLLSLYVLGVVFVATMSISSIVKGVEDKINVSVYFNSDVPEGSILKDKADLENFAEIKSVDYISKDTALANFKRDNADEPVILQSLDEIGDNPLLASLVVKANNPADYQKIADYVSNASFKSDVSRVNYAKNKDYIDKLNVALNQIRRIGLMLVIIFGTVSILIIFNTIRITIYTHRQEIEVMRLVGASNTFIRMPFIFEGIFYGIAASLISMLMLYLTVTFAGSNAGFSGGNIFNPYPGLLMNAKSLYIINFWKIFGVQVLAAAVIGIVSGWIAMRKYLKI